MNSAIAGNGQKIILLVGRKFWVHSWSYFRRGFGVGWDCLVQYWIGFVSGFVRVNVLSTFKFDAVWFMNFSTEFCDLWTLWIGTVIVSLILTIQDWKFMLKFIMILRRIWLLKQIARVLLLHRFNGGSLHCCSCQTHPNIQFTQIFTTLIMHWSSELAEPHACACG